MIKTFLIFLILQFSLQAREINIDTIVDTATKENKHLFIWLHKTGCTYCDNMQEFTLKNADVEKLVETNFIFIHINVSENDLITYQDFKGNGNEFASELGYTFYPSSLFFDNEGEIIFAEVGFIDNEENPNEERIFKILNFVKSKSYEFMDYYDFTYENTKEL